MGNSLLQWLNWLITLATLLGGILMYVKHTRILSSQQKLLNEQNTRLNEQQKLLNEQLKKINDHEIKKAEEEELKKKQAIIEANVFDYTNSSGNKAWKMKLYNKGEATASNIRFESKSLEEDDLINILKNNDTYPIPSLNAKSYIAFPVLLFIGHKKIHKFTFEWDDESGENRSSEQDVLF